MIEYYPFAQDFNKRVIEEYTSKKIPFIRDKRNADGGLTNVKALQTEVIMDAHQIPSIQTFVNWLFRLDFTRILFKADGTPVYLQRLDHFWIAHYNKGDFTISHDHYPAMYSFVYYLRCPRGSSPLVFTTSGKKVKAEEGKLVLFPGHVKHHVPKNRCDGRITIAGNIGWNYVDV